MKDIAILTKYYKNYNYGGVLQGYALKRTLEEKGYETDIISYDVGKNKNPIYKSVVEQSKQYGIKSAINKIIEKVIGKFKFFIKDILNDRITRFEDFMQYDTEEYCDDNISKLNDNYKAFISGSDQVWNPNAVRLLYLQSFANDEKNKISYAASIGRNKLNKNEADVLVSYLKRFNSLSVREKTAKSLLQEYLNEDIEVVLDPTLLLEKEEWDDITTEFNHGKPYALFYFFSNSKKIRKQAIKFCNEKNIDLIMIPYANQQFNFSDSKGPGIRLNSIGPREFVSAIKNADYVFTDSFHGVVFSIIYEKQFLVFERNKKEHVSMNSRIYDILDNFDLANRLLMSDKFNEIYSLNRIDYNIVNMKKQEQKRKSFEFLDRALNK